ncbi:MAG: caspase family protein [Bacteroidota bacterium]
MTAKVSFSGFLPTYLFFLVALFGISNNTDAQSDAYLEAQFQPRLGSETYFHSLMTKDGKKLIKLSSWVGSKGGKFPINIYDLNQFKLISQIVDTTSVYTAIALLKDSKRLYVQSYRNESFFKGSAWSSFWDIENLKKINELPLFYMNNFSVNNRGTKILISKRKEKTIVTSTLTDTILQFEQKGDVYFCKNDSNLLCREIWDNKLILRDVKNAAIIDMWTLQKPLKDFMEPLQLAPDTKHFIVGVYINDNEHALLYGVIENDKIKIISKWYTKKIGHHCLIAEDLQSCYIINSNTLSKYSLPNGDLIYEQDLFPFDKRFASLFTGIVNKEIADIISIKNGDYLFLTDNYNVSYIFSTKNRKVEAYMYTYGAKDYAFVTPDGRMEGTAGAIENLRWRSPGGAKIPLEATYDQMYTPNLMASIFAGTLEKSTVNLNDIMKFTPEIKISSPTSESKTTSSLLPIVCELKANGDEIDKVRIYVNDKLVSDETRGMKAIGNNVTYNVTLLPGVNSVKAIAITKNGYQSAAAEVTVNYSGTVAEARLFVIAIGIDKYKNPAYALNFAVADASSFAERIKTSGSGIFKSINIYSYLNEKAKRDSIIEGFNKIAAQAQPQDAFMLFYAGHGIMSEGSPETPKDFYLVLQNITQSYGNDEMLKNLGISAAELRELSKKITAQKQVIFIDACQSGAAVETFAMRGMAEERAILQLARSTGSYMIASTGTEQYATEFKELGHGVFTYAILQGLDCNADGLEKDKKITIKELEAYLNDKIQALTEKYHGTVQYPKSWSKGMDFPIAVCK